MAWTYSEASLEISSLDACTCARACNDAISWDDCTKTLASEMTWSLDCLASCWASATTLWASARIIGSAVRFTTCCWFNWLNWVKLIPLASPIWESDDVLVSKIGVPSALWGVCVIATTPWFAGTISAIATSDPHGRSLPSFQRSISAISSHHSFTRLYVSSRNDSAGIPSGAWGFLLSFKWMKLPGPCLFWENSVAISALSSMRRNGTRPRWLTSNSVWYFPVTPMRPLVMRPNVIRSLANTSAVWFKLSKRDCSFRFDLSMCETITKTTLSFTRSLIRLKRATFSFGIRLTAHAVSVRLRSRTWCQSKAMMAFGLSFVLGLKNSK